MPTTAPAAKDLPRPNTHAVLLQRDTPITLLGHAAAWFSLGRDGDAVVIAPKTPLPGQCTIRPVALFDHGGVFPEACTAMNRLHFPAGAAQGQRYVPFSHDEHRRLRELILPVETSPEDRGIASAARWRNYDGVTRRLCAAAGLAWRGLSADEIDMFVRFIPHVDSEPLEGCVLHALVQATQGKGQCVIQVGSHRGKNTAVAALALAASGEATPLISVDPDIEEPHNNDHVRLALRQIGQERRLVQIGSGSDRACALLRTGCASLVMIGIDHLAERVRADFLNCRELVSPGGCMVWHASGSGGQEVHDESHSDLRRTVEESTGIDASFRPLLLARTLIAFVKTANH